MIVIDNAIDAATRFFRKAQIETGLPLTLDYASNFLEGVRKIGIQNGNLRGVVTELSDEQTVGTLAEIIFAARGKGEASYIPIIAHTNSYSPDQERFAKVMGIDVIVEKGKGSAGIVCSVMNKLFHNPELYRERPCMIAQQRQVRGYSYFPFEEVDVPMKDKKTPLHRRHYVVQKKIF